MLTTLDIQGVVLIEALRLDFADGLSVLTGETGAGKSILLDSLGLAMGARADAGLVRTGTPQARVTASFDLPAAHPVRAMLEDNGFDPPEDDQIILRRVVKADGGSRAFVNDAPVSAALLREIGAALIEIHGQQDDRGLLNARGHRALLDAFAGLRAETSAVTAAWSSWAAAIAARADAGAALEAAQRDREWLTHAVEELAALKPQPGEDGELAAERTTMQKGARLADDLNAVAALVDGSDGGFARLRSAARRLDRIAPEHPLLTEAAASLDRAIIEAGEAEGYLAAAEAALAINPARLDEAETRLFELRAAARKYRVEPDALAALAEDMTARAAALDAGEAGLAGLDKAVATTRAAYVKAAEALTKARTTGAAKLDAAVMEELRPLKLDAARFRSAIVPLDENGWGPTGRERVEFEVSTNPGAPFGALTKIASGGELSRFVLALKVALAGTGSAGTLIFDEIDRGVGGAVASAIGDRLARLAQTTQVLIVTHSPQVAARAAHQWRIAKSSDGQVTRTGVVELGTLERREEIARMLSGAEVTNEARAQADRLLGLSAPPTQKQATAAATARLL